MTVLQHYYTSYANRDNGSVGFQVKAMSPGMSPDTQAAILRLISYRIPSTLDERVLSTHPVALRYLYRNPQECIFLCSQSSGTDENGRPGNFFAHTLVMAPDFFTIMPPILYWRSAFWRTKDSGSNPSIPPLASLEDIEPSLDIENVWRFLAQGQNVAIFQKLMSAVVHFQKSHRRIVIIDSADNVAQWIAAISCMLPPDYRPMLSFATYHHDPYQSQFMITGTTSDSSFRASPDEYTSYFIYNAATGRISDVEASPYADEAENSARSFSVYETRLLTLFADYMPLFPLPTGIDEQLDAIALYVSMLEPTHPAAFTPAEMGALNIALDALGQVDTLEQNELAKLHRLRKLLWAAYKQEENPEIQTVHDRIVALLKQHKISVEMFVQEGLEYFTQQLVSPREPESLLPRLQKLRTTYGEDVFRKTINGETYLGWLGKNSQGYNPQQLQRIWMYLGQYIAPSMGSSELLFASLQAMHTLRIGNQSGVLQSLMDQMGRATTPNKRAWLQLAADGSTRIPGEELEYFYYTIVAQLPLDQRVPYRTIIKAAGKNILRFEIENDIRSAGPRNGLAKVEEWADHAQRHKIKTESATSYALNQLRNSCSPQEREALAQQVLASRRLAPLSPEAEKIFVQDIMLTVSLSKFSSQRMDLYEKYQDYATLPAETRVVLQGILAMQSGSLDDTFVPQLRNHFKTVTSEDVYRAETRRFIAEFCKTKVGVSPGNHLSMFNALFRWTYGEAFWQSYMEMLIGKLTNSPAQFVELLSFWFRAQPEAMKQKYVVQDFFLRLSAVLEQVRNEQGSGKTIREFHAQAESKRWYPAVQDLLTEKKGMFSTIGQGIGQSILHMPKRFAGQGTDKEAQEREAQEREAQARKVAQRVTDMFVAKRVGTYHVKWIPELYRDRELFWSCYWDSFVKEVVTRDADLTLEVLSFWFDEAYTEFGQQPLMVQEFFLELPQVLELARKERGFRDTAQRIDAKVTKTRSDSYQWYSLVLNSFTGVQASRFNFLRRG